MRLKKLINKLSFICIFLVLFTTIFTNIVYSRLAYVRTGLTGGGGSTLDSISVSVLADGDICWVTTGTNVYFYRFDSTATDAESSPDYIRPDDYSSAGVWYLQSSPFDTYLGSMVSGVAMSGSSQGLVPSNDTDTDHDISLSKGSIMSSDNTAVLKLTSAMVKRIDAVWVAGTGNGGLFSGAVTADTEYHMHLIEKDADGSVDWGFDTSATAANIPAGYTNYAWLGSVWTDGSANIIQFSYIEGLNIMAFDQQSVSPVISAAVSSTSYADITASVQAVVGSGRTRVLLGALANTNNAMIVYLSHDGTNTLTSCRIPNSAAWSDTTDAWEYPSSPSLDYFIDIDNNDIYYKLSSANSTDILLRAAQFIR